MPLLAIVLLVTLHVFKVEHIFCSFVCIRFEICLQFYVVALFCFTLCGRQRQHFVYSCCKTGTNTGNLLLTFVVLYLLICHDRTSKPQTVQLVWNWHNHIQCLCRRIVSDINTEVSFTACSYTYY